MSELDELLDEAEDADGDEEFFDLSDIEEAQTGALPIGEYLCKVTDAKLVKIKSGDNAGKKQFALRFKPVSPASNKLVFKNAQLTGKGAPFTKGLLKNLGVNVAEPISPSKILVDDEGNERLVWLTLSVRKDRPADNNIDASRPYNGEAYGDDEDADEVN